MPKIYISDLSTKKLVYEIDRLNNLYQLEKRPIQKLNLIFRINDLRSWLDARKEKRIFLIKIRFTQKNTLSLQ